MSTNRLYERCAQKGIRPKKVAEVGVYWPETSNILRFIEAGIPALLVEADPDCLERIRSYFADRLQVEIAPYAVWHSEGEIALYRANASTFVAELGGVPALVNDNYEPRGDDRFVAQARRFDQIDDGSIELLSIDVEGAEWYVLKHLRSRPQVISVETHAGEYTNPFLREIRSWMRENGYSFWFINSTDTVFVRKDAASFGPAERAFNLLAAAFNVVVHKLKHLKRSVRRRIVGPRPARSHS
jgi:FkbM family methyltransferase